ncbi:hypothetical protein N7486_001249 [Penicillium sp. IBT 16267x]|nr:hypothetical protein N7486_001249 [Penicillium sp. IBT 16267x]
MDGSMRNDYDLEFELDGICQDFYDIVASPPKLSTEHYLPGQASWEVPKLTGYKTQRPCRVEYYFQTNKEELLALRWTAPDPLCVSTQASDIFLYLSKVFLLEASWVEFRLTKVNFITGETIGEHLFFLPQVETIMGNIHRPSIQIVFIAKNRPPAAFGALDTVSASYSIHNTMYRPATLCVLGFGMTISDLEAASLSKRRVLCVKLP